MTREWTDEQIKGMQARLSEARRQGMWISAFEVGMFLYLLTWWQRTSMRGWARPNDGRLPTIGDARTKGITHIFVTCARPSCRGHSRRLPLDGLHMPPGRRPLEDHMAMLDLANLCRFRCVRCGSRNVSIMADWPDAGHGAEERARRRETPRITG